MAFGDGVNLVQNTQSFAVGIKNGSSLGTLKLCFFLFDFKVYLLTSEAVSIWTASSSNEIDGWLAIRRWTIDND